MKGQLKIVFLLGTLTFLVYSAGYAQNKFRLKPDAGGRQCLNCHADFERILKKPFVHTPVKNGECFGCHNPHTSSHGKLLAEETQKVCSKCHEAVTPEKARSTHKVVLEGNCVKCHDPHASDHKFNLSKTGNELCIGCHKNIGDLVTKVKFKHNPVEKGCINCHDPHASTKSDHLLKKDLVPLCLDCHKPESPSFVKQHMNYPVATARCSSCHNPHGSDRTGLFWNQVHTPVVNKMCSQCHEAPTSPSPFKTKRAGFELCRGCHSSMMNETFNKSRIHWPMVDKVGCLNCHEPHASTSKNLLMGDRKSLCRKCHADTLAFQERLAEKEKEETAAKGQVVKGSLIHNPIQEGNCDVCHFPHAADDIFLLKQPSRVQLCGTCHDWLKHTSHPMGEKILDSRNKNLKVDCLSCHRSHGTGNRYLIPFPTATDLCVQCHKQFRR